MRADLGGGPVSSAFKIIYTDQLDLVRMLAVHPRLVYAFLGDMAEVLNGDRDLSAAEGSQNHPFLLGKFFTFFDILNDLIDACGKDQNAKHDVTGENAENKCDCGNGNDVQHAPLGFARALQIGDNGEVLFDRIQS